MSHFLGIEIGGTKLQLALGAGQGEPFQAFWRGTVETPGRASRIQNQILRGIDELLQEANIDRTAIAGVGIGFGGPVDTQRGSIVTSHQVDGWNDFPIVDWLERQTGWPVVLRNDADSAAFAEAHFGAGRGFDPVVYVTVGSGIGGGLIIGGRVYAGQGAGALEIGHLRPGATPRHVPLPGTTVESIASGFGMTDRARQLVEAAELSGRIGCPSSQRLTELCGGDVRAITTRVIAAGAAERDPLCQALLADATWTLGWALAQVIALVNPSRIVIGGGVSLMGEAAFLEPVREACRANCFVPFRDLAQIVPAALGEQVVVHGALALARAGVERA
jgi:glucokinase